MDSQSDCLLCPSGHYCPDVGLEEPIGKTDGISIKILRHNIITNAPYSCFTSPVFKHLFVGLCLAGFWCREGSNSPSPVDGSTGAACPAGHYCPKGVLKFSATKIILYQPCLTRNMLNLLSLNNIFCLHKLKKETNINH